MMVFAMIIVWFLVKFMTMDNIDVNFSDRSVAKNQFNTDVIKNYVVNVYHSEMTDKREIIVNMLRKLNEYEDPGDFLERNMYLHEYIFNIYTK